MLTFHIVEDPWALVKRQPQKLINWINVKTTEP